MRLSFRPTANTDVWFLSENMRLMDRLECGLSRPDQPVYKTLADSVALTPQAVTAVDPEGEPVAIFGCSFDDSRGYPWMLSTPYISRYGRECLTIGHRAVALWRREAHTRGAQMLCNWVHKKHPSARRFIVRLGFTILPAPTGDFDFFYYHV